MAKKYQFKIKLVKASFVGGRVSVLLSDMFPGNEMSVTAFEGTVAEAVAERQKISDAEPRGHAAFLELADRNARAPVGYKQIKSQIYGGEGSK